LSDNVVKAVRATVATDEKQHRRRLSITLPYGTLPSTKIRMRETHPSSAQPKGFARTANRSSNPISLPRNFVVERFGKSARVRRREMIAVLVNKDIPHHSWANVRRADIIVHIRRGGHVLSDGRFYEWVTDPDDRGPGRRAAFNRRSSFCETIRNIKGHPRSVSYRNDFSSYIGKLFPNIPVSIRHEPIINFNTVWANHLISVYLARN
jgi:hypothetical protein